MIDYRLFVSPDRLVLVRVWNSGHTEVCTRPDPHAVWGPPVEVVEETV